jgi:hypothetical protein
VTSTIEGAISSETTRRHIPRDGNRHWHRTENIKSQIAPQLQIFFLGGGDGGGNIHCNSPPVIGEFVCSSPTSQKRLHYCVMSQFS